MKVSMIYSDLSIDNSHGNCHSCFALNPNTKVIVAGDSSKELAKKLGVSTACLSHAKRSGGKTKGYFVYNGSPKL